MVLVMGEGILKSCLYAVLLQGDSVGLCDCGSFVKDPINNETGFRAWGVVVMRAFFRVAVVRVSGVGVRRL